MRLFDIAARRLEQTVENILNVFADISGLGQARRIDDAKRNAEDASECLGEQSFARSSRADQQDIRFLKLDVAAAFGELESFVMLVNRDRQSRFFDSSWPITYSSRKFFIS